MTTTNDRDALFSLGVLFGFGVPVVAATPDEMRDLVARAAATSGPIVVDAWASRLAADIADATEDG